MLLNNRAGSRLQNSSKSKFKSESVVVFDRPGFTIRPIDDRIENQARDHDFVSCSDDTLPPLEEALKTAKLRGNVQDSLQYLNDPVFDLSRSSQTAMLVENSNSDSQGTRDSPIILEDDEMTNPLSKPPPYLPLLKDASSLHSDGNAKCTSREPGADGLPQPSRKDSEHDCGESVSELEKNMSKAFKEQKDLSSANTPKPLHSHRPRPEPACLQVDQEPDQSAPEVLRDASLLGTQPQDTAVVCAPHLDPSNDTL